MAELSAKLFNNKIRNSIRIYPRRYYVAYNSLLGLHHRTDIGFVQLLCNIQVEIDRYDINIERPLNLNIQHIQTNNNEDIRDVIYMRVISSLIAETISALKVWEHN